MVKLNCYYIKVNEVGQVLIVKEVQLSQTVMSKLKITTVLMKFPKLNQIKDGQQLLALSQYIHNDNIHYLQECFTVLRHDYKFFK